MGEPLADSGIREGSAKIFSVADKDAKGKQNVFYNPAQVYNRDLSILVLTVYSVMRRIEEKEKERTRLKNKKQIWEPYEGAFSHLNLIVCFFRPASYVQFHAVAAPADSLARLSS